MKIIVMVPAYNRVDVLVIDDGSTDRTAEEAKKAGADHIISNKKNIGLAQTFKKGVDAAIELGADIIVNIDADGQYNPNEIPKLVKPIIEGRADFVLGDRQIDSLDHMPFGKKIGNKIATWVTRFASGYPVRDAQTGFRAFSREAALKMNLLGDYTYVQETIIQAVNNGMRVEQVPVEFRRREGQSRLISSIWNYAGRAGLTIIRTYRDTYPLRVFLIIGGFLTFLGLVFGTRVLLHFFKTGMVTPYLPSAVFAVVLITVGVITIIFGMLADMMRSNRLLMEEILYRLKKGEK
ncbi:MAG TPA: glycosyltransferase [Archaeoglobaceae archaeon]|nr:glycosyltransferase [Archaeoglobaceae archaeon]